MELGGVGLTGLLLLVAALPCASRLKRRLAGENQAISSTVDTRVSLMALSAPMLGMSAPLAGDLRPRREDSILSTHPPYFIADAPDARVLSPLASPETGLLAPLSAPSNSQASAMASLNDAALASLQTATINDVDASATLDSL